MKNDINVLKIQKEENCQSNHAMARGEAGMYTLQIMLSHRRSVLKTVQSTEMLGDHEGRK